MNAIAPHASERSGERRRPEQRLLSRAHRGHLREHGGPHAFLYERRESGAVLVAPSARDRAPVRESRASQYGEQAGRRGLRAADADRPRRKSEALPDHAALRDAVPGELAPEISESSSSTFRHGDGDHLS